MSGFIGTETATYARDERPVKYTLKVPQFATFVLRHWTPRKPECHSDTRVEGVGF